MPYKIHRPVARWTVPGPKLSKLRVSVHGGEYIYIYIRRPPPVGGHQAARGKLHPVVSILYVLLSMFYGQWSLAILDVGCWLVRPEHG